MLEGHEYKSHPSFAVIQVSRRNSSRAMPLFGASVGHSNTITITIHRADEIRSTDLSYDNYFAKEQLIEVEMTQTQFAEMITSMNYGSGVPVTIRQFGSEIPENPPVENKRAQHSHEFKEKMVQFSKTLEDGRIELQTLLKKPKLSKDDKHRMNMLFNYMSVNIKDNIPYFEKQFEEQMDKTVGEAKGEIDAFITHAVTRTGLEGLRKEGKMLEDNKKL